MTKLLGLFIIVLIVLNGILLYRLRVHTPQRSFFLRESQVPNLELLSGAEPDTESPFTLLLFFHGEGDCDCLKDWPNWIDISNEFEGVLQVKGIYNGNDKEKFISFAQGYALPFPIYEDRSNAIHQEYKVTPSTVVKILLDSNGSIVFSDSNQFSPLDQNYFRKRLQAHIHRLI